MASEAGAGMSAKDIKDVIHRLEQRAAAEMAGFEAKRPKVEPPPSPPASPSSDSDDSSSEGDNGAGPADAAPDVPPPLPVAGPAPVLDAPPLPVAAPAPVPDVVAAAPPPLQAPAAPKRAARAAGKREAKSRAPKPLRVCPPGYNPDGTTAVQCEFGRKVENGLSTAGAQHSSTCPCYRFWKSATLGPRAEEERAKFEAWKAAGAQ